MRLVIFQNWTPFLLLNYQHHRQFYKTNRTWNRHFTLFVFLIKMNNSNKNSLNLLIIIKDALLKWTQTNNKDVKTNKSIFIFSFPPFPMFKLTHDRRRFPQPSISFPSKIQPTIIKQKKKSNITNLYFTYNQPIDKKQKQLKKYVKY